MTYGTPGYYVLSVTVNQNTKTMKYTIYRNYGYVDQLRYETFDTLEQALELAEWMISGKVCLFRKLEYRETLEIRDDTQRRHWSVVGGYIG